MQLNFRLIPWAASAVMLVGCGGGSSSPNVVSLSTDPQVYTMTDGHVEGARAFCMVNANVSYDKSPNFEASSLTNADGKFKFASTCSSPILAFGGINSDTNLPFKGQLKAPVGSTVITPLTTMLAAGMTESQVIATLNLPAGTKLTSTDPASLVGGKLENPELMQASLAVQQVMMKTTELLASLGGVNITSAAGAADVAKFNDIYQAVAASLVKVLSASSSTALINSSDQVSSSVVNQLVQESAKAASLLQSPVQTAVDKVGTSNLALAATDSLTSQANTLLAADPDTNLQTVTTAMQSNQAIATTITAAVNNGSLTTTTSDTSVGQIASNVTTTTSTTTTTTTTPTTTTTTTLPSSNLYLSQDTINYSDGTGAKSNSYTLTQFQTGAGISVSWPILDAAAIQFELATKGSFVAPTGPVTAAISITDTDPAGKSKVKAYIDNVQVSKTASGLTVAVPSTANAWVYAMAADGSEVVTGFADSVKGVTSTLTTGSSNTIQIGSVITNAIKRVGSMDYMPVVKYRLTLVLKGMDMIKADGSALESYTVQVPVSGGASKTVSGNGIEGYITLVNTKSAPTTTTTTTTTTTSSTVATTTTTTLAANNYLYLANDSLTYDDALGNATAYTLTQFQASPGMSVKWPMATSAALKFTVADGGGFTLSSGQSTAVAMELVDADPNGKAWVKAYIDKVNVTRTGNEVKLTVSDTAFARVYARSTDGSEILSGFANTVAGVTNTFTLGTQSSFVLGSVINNMLASAGNVSGLSGKTFKVTLVASNLQMKLATASALTTATVTVPGSLVTGSAAVSVTGPSLTGYMTLTP